MLPPTNEADDGDRAGELEITTLDARPMRPKRTRWGWRFMLGGRWRVALTVCAIALAIVAPLLTSAPTRTLIIGWLRPATPTASPQVTGAVTIVNAVSGAAGSPDTSPAQWNALRARPLILPVLAPGAACPAAQGRTVDAGFGAAIGDGPVYIVGMGTDGVLHATGPEPGSRGGAAWGNQFAMFIVAPDYTGPVLARGEQIDGAHALLFNGGLDQLGGFSPATPTLLRQLRIEGGTNWGAPWANWATYLRMQAPGCYAIQVDGATFSELIVFRVVFGA
ncbi:MAG TPA: hypothetical protein VF812_07610 [Ktedonobacterales bacterium]